MATFAVTGAMGVDIYAFKVSDLWDNAVYSSTLFKWQSSTGDFDFYGTGFIFPEHGTYPAGGMVNRIVFTSFNGQQTYEVSGLATPAQQFSDWWYDDNGDELMRQSLFAAADVITGAGVTDRLRGYDGADTVTGGAGFDDINGNIGDDSCAGGLGDDWVVGGKDNDALLGEDGDDIVYGNLGNDTCDGGTGADLVRGGQGDDVLVGGAGNDWLSGDRGSDTVTGGAGADVFHTFDEAGVDRVTDFNLAEGDRVQLDPGTTYAVAQVDADVVITLGGAQMTLVGVQLASLTPGWIFES